MQNKYLIALAVTVILLSCKKGSYDQPYSPPPDPPTDTTTGPTTDPPAPAEFVPLKNIVIPNLPSPYYHFEYDTTGKIILASFASGLNTYNAVYNENRIVEMQNNTGASPGRLRYFFDNEGRISFINYINLAGIIEIQYAFSYNGKSLIKLERRRRLNDSLILNKTITMSYYADSNLEKITYHHPKIEGFQDEASITDRFEQYDDKTNVDDFDLLHNDFFDQLVLLPGLKLQKNNPVKETQTGDGDNFIVNYIYTYNDKGLPLTKTGEATITNGTSAGQKFQTNSLYSYY
jgi:hypothetical protein